MVAAMQQNPENRHACPEVTRAFDRVRKELGRKLEGGNYTLLHQAQQLMRDLGVTYQLYREESFRDNIIPLDPFPRILSETEWKYLSTGLEQRTRIWNCFFKDLYDAQEVLKAGIVPFEWVYDDPRYQRAAVGLKVPHETHAHVAAYDLARDKNGRWVVIDDFLSNTTGAIYGLQARHVLGQVAPGLVELFDLVPIQSYATELLEHLRTFGQAAAPEPRVALLSPGIHNHAYYEHSFLARQMGIPLVHGNDLIVLNSCLYLKTIGGLEPIHVLYRRMDDHFIDPVVFREDSSLGVPGLVSCVRKGTLTVVNAIGSGVGDNRAIASLLPRLARFYLNQPLLIPTVERWCLADPDQQEHVMSDLEHWCIYSTRERSDRDVWEPGALSQLRLEELRRQVLNESTYYVAEEPLPPDMLPTCTTQGLEDRHSGLRMFVFAGPENRAHPCALTRYATSPRSRTISSGLGGGIKDTWILQETVPLPSEHAIIIASPQRRIRLGSRIADHLFWMGRYAERAENTARILRVLHQIETENPFFQDPDHWAPLWEALARATGHVSHFFRRTKHHERQTVSHYILLEAKNQSSVFRCIEQCRLNAQATRETVPPEVWVIINRLFLGMDKARTGKRFHDETDMLAIRELERRVIDQLDALSGCAAKTMLHDDPWYFWCMGNYMERAIMTVLVMRQLLLRRPSNGNQAQRNAAHLDALLRMLSSQYAYRSMFQTRPTLQHAAQMLLQDPKLPRSVLFCLYGIRESLMEVAGCTPRESVGSVGQTPVKECGRLIKEVEFVDLTPYFVEPEEGRGPRLRRWLDGLASQLNKLASEVSDHYLHHQAFNILR